MEDCCVVLNPNARAVRKIQLVDQMRQVAPKLRIFETVGPGDGELLARSAAAEGYKTVIAAGGDGTVNEVVRGLVGTSARLGVVPVGTANVFARELGLPLFWEDALYRACTGEEKRVDVGWANGNPFIQVAGVGLDAAAVEAVNPGLKRAVGHLAYIVAGMTVLFGKQPRLRVEVEGQKTLEGVWVLVGLGRLYGGPIPIFPMASNTDGLMDIIVVEDVEVLSLMRLMAGVPFGWHTRMAGVTYLQAPHFHVEGEAAVEVDGEWIGHGPVDFRTSGEMLRVIV